MAKSFLSTLKPLNAKRLQKTVRATVQAGGRLTFTTDAIKDLDLSEEKSLEILASEDGDLGAIICEKNDPDAFALKKCGPYVYITFKNYLQQAGVDYKKYKIIYDITELDEEYKGKPLYKFERRMILRGEDEETDSVDDSSIPASEAPKMPQDAKERPSASNDTLETESATEATPVVADEVSPDLGESETIPVVLTPQH